MSAGMFLGEDGMGLMKAGVDNGIVAGRLPDVITDDIGGESCGATGLEAGGGIGGDGSSTCQSSASWFKISLIFRYTPGFAVIFEFLLTCLPLVYCFSKSMASTGFLIKFFGEAFIRIFCFACYFVILFMESSASPRARLNLSTSCLYLMTSSFSQGDHARP